MKRTLLSLSLLALLASCVNDDVLTQSDFISSITITAEDIRLADSELATRTDLSVTSSGLQFAWAAEDVVGIYPNVGDQVSFPMTKGAGTQSANFDGGGWAVKSGSTYAAYFPYSVDNTTYGRSYTALPLSYTGQSQSANSSTAHLGDYDYMVATASSPSNGTIGFKFTHINSFLYIQLTTPDAATFTKLTLSTDDDLFVEKATVNISTGVITPTQTSTNITLDLADIAVSVGSTLYAWLAVAPTDLSDKTIKATLTTDDGTKYKADIAGKTLATGMAYILKGTVVTEGTGGTGGDIPFDGDDPVYTYVDLGLPSGTLWATCNVGAENPEDYGDYFAWGETEPYYTEGNAQSMALDIYKDDKPDGYNWGSYKWCKGANNNMTKYCTSIYYGTVDDNIVLDSEDDVARMKWDGNWRMPTFAELDELLTECTWTWTQLNGVDGYKVSSNQSDNTNYIFLPAAGYRFGGRLYSGGYYWSSSLYPSGPNRSYNLEFESDSSPAHLDAPNRCYGQPVRPVCAE